MATLYRKAPAAEDRAGHHLGALSSPAAVGSWVVGCLLLGFLVWAWFQLTLAERVPDLEDRFRSPAVALDRNGVDVAASDSRRDRLFGGSGALGRATDG